MHAASVVLYRGAPGRGADGLQAPLAQRPQDLGEVVLVCARARASPGLAQDGDARRLAVGWAPVRREVLQAARRGRALEHWRCPWGDAIGVLYRLPKACLAGWDETGPVTPPPSAFVERHRALATPRSPRQARCEAHRQAPALPRAQHKVLRRLDNHWDGRTVCVGRPAGAMAHNTAERSLRTPVVGRKNY